MRKFQSLFESSIVKVNEVISSLGSTLRTKKVKLKEVRIGLQNENVELNYSISSKISKLPDDLAIESKNMDALTAKTEKVFRNQAQFRKKKGEGVKQSKKENPKPTVKLSVKPKKENKPNYNLASASKGKEMLNKEPIIDDSEEEDPNEHELKRRKDHEAQIDEHQRIVREAEEKEKIEREAQVVLESGKLLFPVWTLERILNEVVDMQKYILDFVSKYKGNNKSDKVLLSVILKVYEVHKRTHQ
ncbi:unnamed protein product [Lactuca saligna]|uniref:Uncharacterized protein n=1 Tax=Lactuca saligna TaxID=75948 RepID=A0AA35ZIF8_LACSI|nr:unnamed protein product [Lactuca saligna]